MNTPPIRRAALVTGLVLVLAVLGWRAQASAGAGQVLVLADRAVAGPLRVVVAPWSARRAVARVTKTNLTESVDLGQGATWPIQVAAELRLDPDALAPETRHVLLGGTDPARLFADTAPAAVTAAVRTLGSKELLARPAALAAPARGAIAAALPAGVVLQSLTTAVAAPPEQARAAALSAVRSATRAPLARVLHVGLDAADWEIVDRMAARGELPTFARLEREGVRANLIPYNPIISPLLWTTALTGRAPDEHGIADFTLQRGDSQDDRIPITSSFRRTAALWEILAAAGQPCGAANHWATQPAEEVPGVLVSDLAARTLESPAAPIPAGIAWPTAFLETQRGEFWNLSTVPNAAVRQYAPALTDAEIEDARRFLRDPDARRRWEAENKKGRKLPPIALLLDMAATAHNVEVLALRMLARPDLGLVSVYFEDIDIAGHGFMHLDPPPMPEAPPEELGKFAGVVENTYRQQDAMLGRLIAAAGPGTAVVVHSDHGFQTGARRPHGILPFTTGQPVEWHRPQGLFVAAGGPFARGRRAGDVSIFDVAPLLLALRGVPAAENMPGRVRLDLLEPEAAARAPHERVPTWDALVAPRRYGQADDASLAEARAQAIEQLRGLGYVDVDEAAKGPKKDAPAAAPSDTSKEYRPSVMYYRNLATFLMGEERFEDAERELEQANASKPLPKNFQLLSECRAARGDVAGATAALEQGFATFPTSMYPDAVRWIVELYLKQGQAARAQEAFERHRALIAGEPGLADAIAGLLAEARGDREGAKASYLRALEAQPRNARAAERFAALASSSAERARLEPYLVRGLRQDYRIDVYWQMLGLFATERGDRLGAAEAFARAAELVPGNEAYQLAAASAWSRAGRLDQAFAIYEHLARAATKNPDVWVNLGSLRARSGDWAGARNAWEQALRLGADGPELRASLDEARRRSR